MKRIERYGRRARLRLTVRRHERCLRAVESFSCCCYGYAAPPILLRFFVPLCLLSYYHLHHRLRAEDVPNFLDLSFV